MEKIFRPGIALLVPTRKRVKRLGEFWNSCLLTCSENKNFRLYLYIDNDDEETVSWAERESLLKLNTNIDYFLPLPQINRIIGPRIKMSQMVNKLYPLVKEEILFFAADDILMRTKDWDKIIMDAFASIPDRIAVMYGEDLNNSQHPIDFATHPIVHQNWVKALGYLSPPYFSCDYADTWINDLADSIGRKYKLPFINEHIHHTNGKAPIDETYIDNRKKFFEENTPKLFRDTWKERQEGIQKLKEFIKNYGHITSTP